MSSPHVAGAYALIKDLHPEWSPAEAQSALMSTARDTVLNDDGINTATPFAQGAGHADLTKAARAGFVLDVTIAEYEAADPALGGDPKSLNVASLGNSQCLAECSWTRTISSTLSTPARPDSGIAPNSMPFSFMTPFASRTPLSIVSQASRVISRPTSTRVFCTSGESSLNLASLMP